ncbi:hypothetical protein ScalyP_jg8152, partial [Parmales sp. scaly parma]
TNFCHTTSGAIEWLRIDYTEDVSNFQSSLDKVKIYNRSGEPQSSRIVGSTLYVGCTADAPPTTAFEASESSFHISTPFLSDLEVYEVFLFPRCYIFIDMSSTGNSNDLNLAEVQALDANGAVITATNATMSSTLNGNPAGNCIDGDLTNMCHTNSQNFPNGYLRIDYIDGTGFIENIDKVKITNRGWGNNRIIGATVYVGCQSGAYPPPATAREASATSYQTYTPFTSDESSYEFTIGCSTTCSYGSGCYQATDACVSCPTGFYNDESNQISNCFSCGFGSSTASTGSTSSDQCICDIGYFHVDDYHHVVVVQGLTKQKYTGDCSGYTDNAVLGYFTDVKKDGSSSVVTTTVTLEDEGDDYSYKFVGLFEPTETATYNFKTRSDDGSWVFFNRELVVDNSGLHGPEDRTGSIDLVGGQSYEIIILYGESGATGELGFWWKGGSVVTDYTQTLGDYFSIFSGESAVVSYCSDCGSGATTASTGAMTIDECSCTEADLTFSRWNNGCSKTTATADVATAFQNASPGDFFLMTPGTLESGSSEQDCDPVCQVTRLLLKDKHVTFMCNIGPSSSEVCTWKGNKGEGESGSGMRVVRIENSGGTTALYLLTIREGDFGNQGGGMFIKDSKVLLYVVSFIDNYANSMAGGLFVFNSDGYNVVLKGCKFEGNTISASSHSQATVDMNDGSELTTVEPCPTESFSTFSQTKSTLALTVPSNFPNTPVCRRLLYLHLLRSRENILPRRMYILHSRSLQPSGRITLSGLLEWKIELRRWSNFQYNLCRLRCGNVGRT